MQYHGFGLKSLCVGRSLKGNDSSAQGALRILMLVVFTCFLGLYSATKVVGAGTGMASLGYAVFGFALIFTIVVLGAIIGFDSLTKNVLEHPWVTAMTTLGDNTMHWVHALSLFFGWAPFFGFLLLSALNQLIRVYVRRERQQWPGPAIQGERPLPRG